MTTTLTAFLADENAAQQRMYPPYLDARWQLSITGRQEFADEAQRLQKALLEHYSRKEPYEQIEGWLAEGGQTSLEDRQLRRLREDYLTRQFAPEHLDRIAALSTGLNTLFTTYRGMFDGQPITDNEAVTILRDSTSSGERRKAWEATKMVAGEAAPRLRELVEVRNEAARALGFPDYWHLKLTAAEVDPVWLMDVWDQLAADTELLWRERKGALDARLAERFGLPVAALRPWHYEDPQFQKAPQNPDANLDAWYREVDIAAVTTATFAAMEQDIADLVPKASLYPAEGKYQSAFCMDVDRAGDIRVCCSIVPCERWMATNLHEFGHAAYDKYVDPALPFTLRTAAHSITTEGVALFMGNLALDPEWMAAFAGISPGAVEPVLPLIRRQKQLEDLIFTRYEQVMVRFEQALYADPAQDLNTLWWDLAERYQGLTRPEERDWPDWASKVHFSTAPCMYHHYLLGYMFITQLTAHLRHEITHGGPLATPAVGRYLRERVYQPGASVRWDALIAQATEEALNPAHWVRYLGE